MKKEKRKAISIKLPPDLIKKIEQTGPKTTVIEIAVTEYLNRQFKNRDLGEIWSKER